MQTTAGSGASGLLYEGSSFTEWLKSLRPVLAHHFPGIDIADSEIQRSCFYYILELPLNVDESDVCDSIWWHVSPHVRCRVSKHSRGTPNRLLNALRATAQPFRFLDLPAEIRLKVYGLALASSTSRKTLKVFRREEDLFNVTNDHKFESSLLSINHQIRLETLPIFHRANPFRLRFTACIKRLPDLRAARSRSGLRKRPTPTERVHAINQWASNLMPDSTRLLRRIHVQLPLLAVCRKHDDDMLRFTLSPVDGKLVLKVEEHAWLASGSQQLLSDHAATISKLAQSLKLEGEALIMVLTSRPDIWDQLVLAKKLW
jgi:hypothetical protein